MAWSLPNFWDNTSNTSGSQTGFSFGWMSPYGAAGQASSIELENLLNVMDAYASQQTNAQKEINQDFFNQQKEFNASQANIERAWQEKLSNTAYQRMVQDLEKAGLSKLLAYNSNPSSISSVGGASVGLPSSSRGSDATNALASLASSNANKQTGIIGGIMQLVGALIGSLASISDWSAKTKK